MEKPTKASSAKQTGPQERARKLTKGKKTIDINHLRNNVKLMIGTPMYGGNSTESYQRSSLALTGACAKHGIELSWCTLANESLIPRGRNIIVNSFLNSDCTHLMFIDADIGYEWQSVIKLIMADKSIVGGAYPKKGLNWEAIAKAAKDGVPPEQLLYHGAKYAMNFKFVDPVAKTIRLEDGLTEVKDLATGFMMIKRHVFEDMIKHYPEFEYRNDLNLGKRKFDRWFAFFDTAIEPTVNGRLGVYNSEDYYFCRRWQEMGGQIWLDPFIKLDHYGHFKFAGNPEAILGRPDSTNSTQI